MLASRRTITLLATCLVATTAVLSAAASPGTPRRVALEGAFGKVVVNLDRPQLEALWLREPTGDLSQHSVLATEQEPLPSTSRAAPYVDGGYTYVVEANDDEPRAPDPYRYESRNSRSHRVSIDRHRSGRVTEIRLRGIELSSPSGGDSPVVEDWVLRVNRAGELEWSITQRWRRDIDVGLSGTPALFLRPFGGCAPFCFGGQDDGEHSGMPGKLPNITTTVWHNPKRLVAEDHYLYGDPSRAASGLAATVTTQTFLDQGGRAVYKLFDNLALKSDIELMAAGAGHLYRRAGRNAEFSEIGVQGASTLAYRRGAGTVSRATLTVAPSDKRSTGQQLAIDLPDSRLEADMAQMYGSLLNGGAVTNNKTYNFGNQSDGVQYAGSSDWYAGAAAAGVPADRPTSSHPFTMQQAVRAHLDAILSTVGDDGLARFGYGGAVWNGKTYDDNLHALIASRAHYMATGDLSFVRRHLPAYERMAEFFTDHIDPSNGVFRLPAGTTHWYYEIPMQWDYSTYYNVFLVKALNDLADLERAAGRAAAANRYRATAASLKEGVNRVLWNPDAPGGARYSDWIVLESPLPGKVLPGRKEYFVDLAQWTAIAFDVATPAQARKIVATADRRLAELERDFGYRGHCTPSSLWPQTDGDRVSPFEMEFGVVIPNQFFFGRHTHGGCLLAGTYYEIVGRAKAGDTGGAYRRLKRFAERYREIGWVGQGGATINGEMDNDDTSHGGGEPYLADMVVVPASLVFGVLGIAPTLDGLDVTPRLPRGWSRACAEVDYLGVRHRVDIEHGRPTVEPLGRAQTPRRSTHPEPGRRPRGRPCGGRPSG